MCAENVSFYLVNNIKLNLNYTFSNSQKWMHGLLLNNKWHANFMTMKTKYYGKFYCVNKRCDSKVCLKYFTMNKNKFSEHLFSSFFPSSVSLLCTVACKEYGRYDFFFVLVFQLVHTVWYTKYQRSKSNVYQELWFDL